MFLPLLFIWAMPNNLFIIHNLNNTVVHKNRSELKSNHSNRNTFDFLRYILPVLFLGKEKEGCILGAFHIIRFLLLNKVCCEQFPISSNNGNSYRVWNMWRSVCVIQPFSVVGDLGFSPTVHPEVPSLLSNAGGCKFPWSQSLSLS